MSPTYPATGYGYIKSEKKLDCNEYNPSKVDKFIEKPDEKTAKYFVKDPKYSWNSGMFVFKATAIINEIKISLQKYSKIAKNVSKKVK